MIDIDGLCHLEILHGSINQNEKINVVTTSLFQMKRGYKNFEKYIRGLELLNQTFFKTFPDIKFMLFIDESITSNPSVFNRIRKLQNDRMILIKYHCTRFIRDNTHLELFGTLVRFLPFFNYQQNNTNHVICIDADINQADIDNIIENYHFFNKFKSDYHYDTNMFYEIMSKWALPNDYTIIASRHICKYKFPIEMLTNFLNCTLEKSCDDLDNMNTVLDYQKYQLFPYGIDEYFLNYVLLPYIKEHRLLYSIYIRYIIMAPLYFLKRCNKIEIESDTGKYFNEQMKYILGESSRNFKEAIDKFDRTFYPYIYGSDTDIRTSDIVIAQQYYQFIQQLWNNQDYRIFPKSILKKILLRKNYISKNNVNLYRNGSLIKAEIYLPKTIRIKN